MSWRDWERFLNDPSPDAGIAAIEGNPNMAEDALVEAIIQAVHGNNRTAIYNLAKLVIRYVWVMQHPRDKEKGDETE